MKLWDRIKRGMDAGFDAAVAAVYNITEKAGESIELTRLRREKVRLETDLTKHLAGLGNVVYEKISEARLDEVTEKLIWSNYTTLAHLDDGAMSEFHV